MLQVVQFDQGGIIKLRVPDASALSSAAVTLYRPNGDELDLQTLEVGYAASVTSQAESGDYTVLTLDTGDEGEGEPEGPGAPPTSLRGRRIRCIMAVGPIVEPIVEAVGDDSVTVRLPRRCGTVTAILDPVLEAVVAPMEEADVLDGYRAVFAFTAGSTAKSDTVRFAIAHRVYGGLTMADIQTRTPSLHRILSSRDQDWLALTETATDLLEMQISRLGERARCIAERDQVLPLLVDAFRLAAALDGVMPDDFAAESVTAYQDVLRRTFVRHCEDVLRTAYLISKTGTVHTAGPRPIASITVRR
jgi:hypothetical protein